MKFVSGISNENSEWQILRGHEWQINLFKWNESSTVDYGNMHKDLLNKIELFNVSELVGHIL